GLFRVEIAKLYNRNDDKLGPLPKATALEILNSIKDKDPATVAAAESLKRRITEKALSVRAQEVYPTVSNLLLHLNYRNLERVYHKVVRLDDDTEVNSYRPNPEQLDAWRKAKSLVAKNFRLADNDDYNSHSTETWLPQLASGRYVFLTSDNKQFKYDGGILTANVFQVSDLALVTINDEQAPYYEVLHRTTGAIRPGVKVTVYRKQDRRGNWKKASTLTTDEQGRFQQPKLNRSQVRYLLEDGKDRFLSDATYVYQNRQNDYEPENRPFTPLFTDRSIYRPGQTVHIYGITGEMDPKDMPQLLTNEKVTLTLYDANGQEVDKVEVSSDEFSRFNHSFKLPQGGLTGNFYVNTDGGSINFRVEEYKRPKFKVELTAPDFAVAGEATEVTGKATLFAGPGLDDAAVNYRVFREEVRWFWWGRGGGGQDRELVTSGETTTDDDGGFTITFTPDDDLGSSRTRYRYVVEADVADDTGETHPAETSVALRSEKPVVSLQPDKDMLDVTDTLKLRASGTEDDLTITYRLVPVTKPDAALTQRNWSFPDRPVLDTEEYRERFPDFAAVGATDFDEWPATVPVIEGQLDLKKGQGALALPLDDYSFGHYRLEWNYPDGTAGEASHIKVFDSQRGALPAGILFHLAGLDQSVAVGQPLTLRLISSLPLPYINYSFGSRKGQAESVTSATNASTITYQVEEGDRGGIGFTYRFVRNGDFFQSSQNFGLGWDNKKLQIDYATFRDKLRPGTPERWTLTVKNADGTPVNAAAVASMYDASLDQKYSGQQWQFNPWPSYYDNRENASFANGGSTYGRGRANFEYAPLPKVIGPPSLDLSPFGWYGRTRNIRSKRARVAGV
ncbi:MAG: MG2 domain-containing protein, partial [Bacteroidota bacterium]